MTTTPTTADELSPTFADDAARPVWPFFAIAVTLIILGQLVFYMIAFFAGDDPVVPPSAPVVESK